MQIDMTIDDPAYYTAAWPSRKMLTRSTTGFSRYQWVCSVRDNYDMYEKSYKDANSSGVTTFEKK